MSSRQACSSVAVQGWMGPPPTGAGQRPFLPWELKRFWGSCHLESRTLCFRNGNEGDVSFLGPSVCSPRNCSGTSGCEFLNFRVLTIRGIQTWDDPGSEGLLSHPCEHGSEQEPRHEVSVALTSRQSWWL